MLYQSGVIKFRKHKWLSLALGILIHGNYGAFLNYKYRGTTVKNYFNFSLLKFILYTFNFVRKENKNYKNKNDMTSELSLMENLNYNSCIYHVLRSNIKVRMRSFRFLTN